MSAVGTLAFEALDLLPSSDLIEALSRADHPGYYNPDDSLERVLRHGINTSYVLQGLVIGLAVGAGKMPDTAVLNAITADAAYRMERARRRATRAALGTSRPNPAPSTRAANTAAILAALSLTQTQATATPAEKTSPSTPKTG